jgi:hypothetical protein
MAVEDVVVVAMAVEDVVAMVVVGHSVSKLSVKKFRLSGSKSVHVGMQSVQLL